ncbi:MAG: sigma-70 family RNA polymerase sigma factor [Armatimonadetes bacterium]|nr:sigma-70 family RNA polymerase sigma factor [Armatimonadota bacterium]MCX7969427.1 sigma-70 family RNA polymerase sigma factor [Armatimonadota bacterium]MDW8143673.1 sigma-70 family RNA polymerase sigma factor [Armatimonadota bacterium]
MDERHLLERCGKGDERAWAELVNRYWGLAFRIAYRILRNKEDAEDAAQEAFVQVYRSLPTFQHRSNFRTWFYRIVVRVAMAHLSSESAEPLEESAEAEILECAREDPEKILLAREREQLLDWAIQQLPPDWRAVLVLREIEGLSYAEIAEILGIPIGTVESRLFRARKKLRQILEPILGDEWR